MIEEITRSFRSQNPGTLVTNVHDRGDVVEVVFWAPGTVGFQSTTGKRTADGEFAFAV